MLDDAGADPAGRPGGRRTAAGEDPPRRASARLGRLGLLAYLLVPALATLTPDAPSAGVDGVRGALQGLVSRLSGGHAEVSFQETEALANVLLFVPVGVLLRLAWPRAGLTVLLLAAALGSLAIEVAQDLLLPSRQPSLIDVATNAGGAAIGLVLAVDALRLAARRRPG